MALRAGIVVMLTKNAAVGALEAMLASPGVHAPQPLAEVGQGLPIARYLQGGVAEECRTVARRRGTLGVATMGVRTAHLLPRLEFAPPPAMTQDRTVPAASRAGGPRLLPCFLYYCGGRGGWVCSCSRCV